MLAQSSNKILGWWSKSESLDINVMFTATNVDEITWKVQEKGRMHACGSSTQHRQAYLQSTFPVKENAIWEFVIIDFNIILINNKKKWN